jgi:hypothetical protein
MFERTSGDAMKRPAAKSKGTTPTRRRRYDHVHRERTSLSLRADVLESAKSIVRAGGAENLSAFVEAAIEEKMLRGRQAALYTAYERAAQDAAFRSEMRAVASDFAATERDGL